MLRLKSEVAYNLTFEVFTNDLIWHYCRTNEMQTLTSRTVKSWQQIVLGATEAIPIALLKANVHDRKSLDVQPSLPLGRKP